MGSKLRTDDGPSKLNLMMEWSREQTATVPRKTLVWLGAIAVACLLVLGLAAHMRQDAMDQQVSELRYRLEAMERRPARLSDSDRAAIQDSTEVQVNQALQSAKR